MGVGAEFTPPVSVLEGRMHAPSQAEPHPSKNGALDPEDDSPLASSEQEKRAIRGEPEKRSNGAGRELAAGRPPQPPTTTIRRCITTSHLSGICHTHTVEDSADITKARGALKREFAPLIRAGGWADIGCRRQMEDTHIIVNDLTSVGGRCGAYYGVFDGHSGNHAAMFVREHLLSFILENTSFPSALNEAVKQAFLRTDQAFAEACQVDDQLCSGTTALTVLILGRTLLVANAGDCRAVLCKRGKAIEMSRDHKAACAVEKRRIESSGGFVDNFGYLNGELTVARALGDWHLDGLKEFGIDGPLTAVPEMHEVSLTEEDEFIILGCDGLWDVFSSQNAVDFARKHLQVHNDPQLCSKELVTEALRRDSCDNLTVVMVCFQEVLPFRSVTPVMSPVKRSISAEGLQCLSAALQEVMERCYDD